MWLLNWICVFVSLTKSGFVVEGSCREDNCDKWAAVGECNNNAAYMTQTSLLRKP